MVALEVDPEAVPQLPEAVLEEGHHLVAVALEVALDPMKASVITVETDLMQVAALVHLLHLQVHLLLTDLQSSEDLQYLLDLDPDVLDSMDLLVQEIALDLLADQELVVVQALEAVLDLPVDLALEAVQDPQVWAAETDPLVDPVSVVITDPLAVLVSVDVPVDPDLHPHPHPGPIKILVEAEEIVASKAPNLASVVNGPMALLQLTGRIPKDPLYSTNSKVPTGTNSVPAGSETSTIPSVRRFANVPASLGTPQIVTNSMSATGTSGWRSTPCTSSPAPSCWASTPASRLAVGLLMDLSANTNN